MIATVRFLTRGGGEIVAHATAEATLLSLAQAHGLPLEGTCEGQMACATCHVIIDPTTAARLACPSDAEEDMLDMAVGTQRHSRLSCQVAVSPLLDGATVQIP